MSKESPIKVLFLPRWYPHRYDPMPGLFIQRHALAVAPLADVAVLYVHADTKMKQKRFEINDIQNESIKEVRVYFKKYDKLPGLLKQLLTFIMSVYAHYKGYSYIKKNWGTPDINHVNVLTREGVFAYILKRFFKIPYVITEHWGRYLPTRNEFKGILRRWITRVVVKKAGAVLPVNKYLMTGMTQNGLKNNNYIIVPNVIDTDLFSPGEKYYYQKKKIIHISCFTDIHKNISGILRSIHSLSKRRQDFELFLIGDGDDFHQMVSYAKKLGIYNRFVFFKGLKENKELVQEIRNADFHLLFSLEENFAIVNLECAACGLPIVSSDAGGIPEYLSKDMGILVPNGDEKSLVAKLNFMLDHFQYYDKNLIRENVIKNFSTKVVAHQLFSIYSKVVKQQEQ